jgi:endonuclease/exonuclease/phosphatase family metal-dependent hydrolase
MAGASFLGMLRRVSFLALMSLMALGGSLFAREFTVLTYNVENLFDVDGVAEYGDYRDAPLEKENPYTPARFLTKLQHIAEALAAVNEGAGPEVILFQELEFDRTPYGQPATADAFLRAYSDTTVEVMLTTEFSHEVAQLPAEFFLLKLLEDNGMGPYHLAVPDPAKMEHFSAQKCVVFSKFPINWQRQRVMSDARDLQIVSLDVEGHEFIVLNNHWKSGASNPSTEPIRVQNAQVVRAAFEALLLDNPSADVLIAGDLNSYYNQSAAQPDLGVTGVNTILGSSTDEAAHVAGENRGLYNLWGELPLEERGSETYRGSWGTLMQMLLSRGLYDEAGVQYVDNSFFRLILPGRNVETRWGTPKSWVNYGDGGGFSDHLPIGARFRTVETGNTNQFLAPTQFSGEATEPAERPVVAFERLDRRAVPRSDSLEGLEGADLVDRVGDLFALRAEVVESGRLVKVGDRIYGLYSPHRSIRDRLSAIPEGALLKSFALLGSYRGELQWVIESENWIQE